MSFAAKVVVSEWRERRAIEPDAPGAPGGDRSDARQREAFEVRRNGGLGPDREKQLIVLAAVERLVEGRAGNRGGRT